MDGAKVSSDIARRAAGRRDPNGGLPSTSARPDPSRGARPLSSQHWPAAQRIFLSVVPRMAALWIRLTRVTSRIRYNNREVIDELARQRQPYILAFWHGRLFLMPYAYPGRRIAILISHHRDGEYISRTMERFGFVTARGSSSRRGASGLREIVRKIREGYDAAFTPDGPRGPRARVQPGVIAAARLSGAPIVPVAFSSSKKNSWRPGIASSSRCPSAADSFFMVIRWS